MKKIRSAVTSVAVAGALLFSGSVLTGTAHATSGGGTAATAEEGAAGTYRLASCQAYLQGAGYSVGPKVLASCAQGTLLTPWAYDNCVDMLASLGVTQTHRHAACELAAGR